VTLSTDELFLVINQTAATENGLYLYKGTGNAAVRADDLNADAEFPSAAVFVKQGTCEGCAFVCTNDSVTIGVTSIVFTQFSSAIANNSITTAKIVDGAVTEAKVGSTVLDRLVFAFAYVTGADSTQTLSDAYNVSSVTRNSVGDFTVNFTSSASSANYAAIISPGDESGSNNYIVGEVQSRATGSFNFTVRARGTGNLTDPTTLDIFVFTTNQ
jgi:hypothetical protein